MKAIVSVSLGLVSVGLATLNVITIEGNDRAQVQKPSCDFDAAWIVDLCHLRRPRSHPCAPVRIGQNQSFNFDCEILAGTYCLVLRFYGPFSITPARLFADESSNSFTIFPTAIETALRHLLS